MHIHTYHASISNDYYSTCTIFFYVHQLLKIKQLKICGIVFISSLIIYYAMPFTCRSSNINEGYYGILILASMLLIVVIVFICLKTSTDMEFLYLFQVRKSLCERYHMKVMVTLLFLFLVGGLTSIFYFHERQVLYLSLSTIQFDQSTRALQMSNNDNEIVLSGSLGRELPQTRPYDCSPEKEHG